MKHTTSYYSDNRLEIVILGPMRDGKDSTNGHIQTAVLNLCEESDIKAILVKNGVSDIVVTFPEEWRDNIIADGVFNKLDTADLILVNITPKEGKEDPTPNVFYELGIVHSLGLPYMTLLMEGFSAPFYARDNRQYRFKSPSVEEFMRVLRIPLLSFLNEQSDDDFTMNAVSRFYEDLPIVDISAAVGLATSYYMNYARRFIRDAGPRNEHRDIMRHFVYVRPEDVLSTYGTQVALMKSRLAEADIRLSNAEIENPSDGLSNLWFDHIDGIVVDVPRAIFPLKLSPRLMSLRRRTGNGLNDANEAKRNALVSRVTQRLLDRIEVVMKYHIRNEMEPVDSTMVHFSTLENLPTLIEELR